MQSTYVCEVEDERWILPVIPHRMQSTYMCEVEDLIDRDIKHIILDAIYLHVVHEVNDFDTTYIK